MTELIRRVWSGASANDENGTGDHDPYLVEIAQRTVRTGARRKPR